MKDLYDIVYDEYKYLIKTDDKNNKYVVKDDINNLQLSSQEKGFIRLAFTMKGVEEVDSFIVTKKDEHEKQNLKKPKKVKDLNYGEVEALGLGHLDKPRLAKIEYDGKDIVFEDYTELDEFILNSFIPENVQMKVNYSSNRKDYSLNKPYPSIQLNKIVKLGFSEMEIKHILELLDNEGIHVGGMSSEMDNENKSYDYIPTNNIIQEYCDKVLGEALSKEEMKEKFIEFYETRDPVLREELILRNIRLVGFCTWKVAQKNDLSRYDLDTYGYEGLIYAVENYNPYLDNAFSSYAVPCITGYTRRGVLEVKGEQNSSLFWDFQRIKRVVEEDTGCKLEEDPTMLDDIIDTMIAQGYINEENRDYYYRYFSKDISFEELGENRDVIISEDEGLNKRDIFNETFRELIENRMTKILSEREIKVLRLRYGMDDGEPKTLKQIGRIMGLTDSRVRQIEAKAIGKMRRDVQKKKFEGLLDDAYQGNNELNDMLRKIDNYEDDDIRKEM